MKITLKAIRDLTKSYKKLLLEVLSITGRASGYYSNANVFVP
jgi:hypothetical protein